jgi:1-acyl-sn-glycerol-3-phosphate acyltransferase
VNPVGLLLVGLTRALVGASARWIGCGPSDEQRIYFANHSSHIDTLAIWAALPPQLRAHTRAVAARDYWGGGGIRRFIAERGFNAVFIERVAQNREGDPLLPLYAALERGDSLIIFPEGTRGTEALPGPFRSGLFHLAQHFPTVNLIPVYLENLHRAMPKGARVPVPLICTARFGAPLPRLAGEQKDAFLERARSAVVALA